MPIFWPFVGTFAAVLKGMAFGNDDPGKLSAYDIVTGDNLWWVEAASGSYPTYASTVAAAMAIGDRFTGYSLSPDGKKLVAIGTVSVTYDSALQIMPGIYIFDLVTNVYTSWGMPDYLSSVGSVSTNPVAAVWGDNSTVIVMAANSLSTRGGSIFWQTLWNFSSTPSIDSGSVDAGMAIEDWYVGLALPPLPL